MPILRHLVWFGINVAVLNAAEANARAIAYAIVASLYARYFLLSLYLRLYRRLPMLRALLQRLARHPSKRGAYLGKGAMTPIYGHLILLSCFAWIPVVVANLGHEPSASTIRSDLLTAGVIFVAFELRTLFNKGVIVDYEASNEINAMYNFGPTITLLVFVPLGLGAAMAVRSALLRFLSGGSSPDLGSPDWIVMIVMLAVVELSEFSARPDPVFSRPREGTE